MRSRSCRLLCPPFGTSSPDEVGSAAASGGIGVDAASGTAGGGAGAGWLWLIDVLVALGGSSVPEKCPVKGLVPP